MDILSGYSAEQILASNLGSSYANAARVAQSRDRGPLVCVLDIGETKQTFTCGVAVTPIALAFAWTRCIQWRGNWTDAIEYKKIVRPGDLDRLRRFLEASDQLCGTLLVVSIPKADPVFIDEGDGELEAWRSALGFELGKHLFKRLRCVSAVMTAALVPFKHEFDFIHWWSDRDELFQPNERAMAVKELISRRLSLALGRTMTAWLTTEDGVRDRLFARDLVALPDIAAGGIADFNQCRLECYGRAEGLYLPTPDGVKPKAQTVAEWFALPQRGLCKVSLELGVERDAEGKRTCYTVSKMSYERTRRILAG